MEDKPARKIGPVMDVPLALLAQRFAVCRLGSEATWPEWARSGALLALVRTRSEVSVTCEERFVPPEVKAERGWRALRVEGQLDFSLVGVLAGISTCLAEAGVSLFVVSTFDTDYVLVKDGLLDRALDALRSGGYVVQEEAGPTARLA
jgi:uncharacterized protein